MTERESTDDGAIADLPWAAVFDAAANVRALGAVQAQGFRAASRLVDRFVMSGEPARTPADLGESDNVPGSPDTGRSAPPSVDRLITGWESLTRQLSRTLVAAPSDARGPVFDVGAAESVGRVVLTGSVDRGADGPAAEVWLHNGGPHDHGEVRLRCSDLLAHDGTLICAAAVHFDPDPVPLPARSSRGVLISMTVPEQVRAGVYRGTVLVYGHPGIWLPIEVDLGSTS
jgi:hypothetical protein